MPPDGGTVLEFEKARLLRKALVRTERLFLAMFVVPSPLDGRTMLVKHATSSAGVGKLTKM